MSINNKTNLEYKKQRNISESISEKKNHENKKVYIINTPYEKLSILDDCPKKKIRRR